MVMAKRKPDIQYDIIDSNYLTEENHADDIRLELVVEVYGIAYDWGRVISEGLPDGSGVVTEWQAPIYEGTLDGYVTSANFSIDSTSDMRSSCSLSIILDYNSPFISHADDYNYWAGVWLRIIKKYSYPNNIADYPKHDWDGKQGLWNNNGLFQSDPSESVIGWFVPIENSTSYNAETREFSISCTDMMSCFTESRGGHLSPYNESAAGIGYNFYDTENAYVEAGIDTGNNFAMDKQLSALRANGFIIEGEKTLQISDKQYNNYFAQVKERGEKPSAIWESSYNTYVQSDPDDSSNFNYIPSKISDSALATISRIVADYGQFIPFTGLYIKLQKDYAQLPYDIDISGDTSLYETLKKITDLYPRQYIYFDTDRQLNLKQTALAWRDTTDGVDYRAKEFSGLIVEEHWNTNYENISNYVFVYGRDQTCHGYYWITPFKGLCEQCGTVYDYPAMPANPDIRYCPKCGKFSPLKRLYVTDEAFSTTLIGTHKKVVYDDNLITERECIDAAKAIALESCRAAKTLSVTLDDRYLSMYQLADKGVGHRIEYKSKLTGETNVYNVLKWSNDFTSGLVTMELEPYYTCANEYDVFYDTKAGLSCSILPMPTFTYSVDDEGVMTLIINNGKFTKYSLFKIYCREDNQYTQSEDYFWFLAFDMHFIGETCEVYTEETETECQTKVFRYKFDKNGKYAITCQAWNPNIHPSSCPEPQVVTVDCYKDRLVTHDGQYLTTSKGEYILYS